MENNEINKYEPSFNAPSQPGKGVGIASFVIGLLSITWPVWTYLFAVLFYKIEANALGDIFLWLLITTSIANVIFGTLGVCLSAASKKQGNKSGLRAAGFALSLISLILGALTLLCCLACIACTGLAVKDLYSDALQMVGDAYQETVDQALGVLIFR